MYRPQKRAWGSAYFPGCQKPFECAGVFVWPVPAQRRADRTAALGSPGWLSPCALRSSLCVGWWDGLLQDQLEEGGHLSSTLFHGFPWFLCVFQSFFQQVLFTYSSELKELLCSRRHRKHRPVWGWGHHHCSWLTCRWDWMGSVFQKELGRVECCPEA